MASATDKPAWLALYDLFLSIDLIEQAVANETLESFVKKPDLVREVCTQLKAITEIAKTVPAEFRLQNPEVPWDILKVLELSAGSLETDQNLPLLWIMLKRRVFPLQESVQPLIESHLA